MPRSNCAMLFPPVAPAAASATLLALALAIAGCATRAPDFAGQWRPLNTYAAQPRAIALQPAIEFAPSPVDGTLRTLLARWARAAGLELRYEAPDDYTLHAAVSGVRAADLRAALAQLEVAYAAQRIALRVDGRILRAAPLAAVDPPPAR